MSTTDHWTTPSTAAAGNPHVHPLGLRELVDGDVFVNPIGVDIGAERLSRVAETIDRAGSATLVCCDVDVPNDADSVPAAPDDLVAAMRVPAHRIGEVEPLLHIAAHYHGAAATVVLVDGADPWTHPAAVADHLRRVLDTGLCSAIGVLGHTQAQTRALDAHLARRHRLAVVGVAFERVDDATITDGQLDLCLEIGAIPLLPATGHLVDDPNALAAVLHHPSRPVALVDHGNVRARVAAISAASTPLDRQALRTLVPPAADTEADS